MNVYCPGGEVQVNRIDGNKCVCGNTRSMRVLTPK